MLFMLPLAAHAQYQVKGNVTDETGSPLIGATVVMDGNAKVATVTDLDGNFVLSVPTKSAVLKVSYVGMKDQRVTAVYGKSNSITLKDDDRTLQETVVIGFGQQKKASLIGSITQTDGKTLERAAGISDIGNALAGNLPGVVTSVGSGAPGDDEPQIQIRSSSSWNGSSPLVLVDGVERPMSGVDIQSVQSISVLKDASATAVFGVKGANGVILITTKRGQEGRAKISATANVTMKVPSKLPGKKDSYDALLARNDAIEHQLSLDPNAWGSMRSQEFINNYRNQTTVEQRERYANVDWQKELFKDYCMSYNANINVAGGTQFVKYFASVDFVHEGDLFKIFDNHRGYKSGFGYNRVNVRSNLDFQLSKTTNFKVNLSGSNGQKTTPLANAGDAWQESQRWAGAYNIAPDVFLPQYSDGSWGYYTGTNITNSAENLSLAGVQHNTTTRVYTDFILDQDLSFITKGLRFHGMLSWDNNFQETGHGVNDLYNDAQRKYIDPVTGAVSYKQSYESSNKFDFQQGVMWTTQAGTVQDWATARNTQYQLQLNWGRKFGLHDVSAMGLFQRSERAQGSMIPEFREDWVFRATYNYAQKYFAEYSGAYNGSERFSKDNRFAFFQSGSIGWMLSEEKFIKDNVKWLDMLKLRASYGEIGDDSGARFLYMDEWAYGGQTSLDIDRADSPYKWYRESKIGNPDVHWEVVKKFNFGLDWGILHGLFTGTVDIFHDHRSDIKTGKPMPMYFGIDSPTYNLGVVDANGYEFTLKFNKVFPNTMRVWADMNMTHAVNKVKVKADQALLPDYRKEAGYSIGQTRSHLESGFLNTYDDIYGAPKFDTNNGLKLPGDYYILDFNGDGIVDVNDSAPTGFASMPQNTYNATLGFAYKGFSCFVQFYGVTNVTRDVTMTDFSGTINTVYDHGTWWSKDHQNADIPPSRWAMSQAAYVNGSHYKCDGSYIRLKNVELSYEFSKEKFMRSLGLSSLRFYVNANNLWLWTRMPDDRESNLGGWSGGQGAYPTVKRINFGMKLAF